MRVKDRPICFRRRDESGTRIVLTAVGDLMMQNQTLRAAQQAMGLALGDPEERAASGFLDLLAAVRADLNRGDLLIGNLETPLADGLLAQRTLSDGRLLCREAVARPGVLYDGLVYGQVPYPRLPGGPGLPNFNCHPALARALKAAGFGLVSTANNHALDRGHNGIDRTVDALRRSGLDYVGTLRSDEAATSATSGVYPCLVKEVQGIRLAFLSLTSFLNSELVGIPDRCGQVCMLPRRSQKEQAHRLLSTVGRLRADPEIDLVAVLSHWGTDNTPWVWTAQRDWAHCLLDAGADLVVGHHPHLLQPMEIYETADGREAFVIYSLGNFTSDMWGVSCRSSAILYLTIAKNHTGAFLSSVRYLPVARQDCVDERTGRRLIRPVPIDGESRAYARNRDHIVRVLGAGNRVEPGGREPL